MKKVRFQTYDTVEMNDSECHSPRPFLEKRINTEDTSPCYGNTKPLTFSLDPVHRFESSNSLPYPLVNGTNLNNSFSPVPRWNPSSELELSMLDATYHEPRKPPKNPVIYQPHLPILSSDSRNDKLANPTILDSIENTNKEICRNMRTVDNSFFITKGNPDKFQMKSFSNLHRHFNMMTLDKENNPASKKLEIMNKGKILELPLAKLESEKLVSLHSSPRSNISDCSCHHCARIVQSCDSPTNQGCFEENVCTSNLVRQCRKLLPSSCKCSQCACQRSHQMHPPCHAPSNICEPKPQIAVDKKTWAIEKYEQSKNPQNAEVQKPTSVKEKREPTVADLFKIIKLQNEQLQLLQEKVDKFITSGNNKPSNIPIQSYSSEHVALETMNNEEHKISIGVMTSFEMVRTSTVINKEVIQQKENSQVQCNRSQISIKEVVSKSPVNLNFLDGIAPVGSNVQGSVIGKIMNGNFEEKTLNEFSLFNVQVDNATTPLMSPEQTLYLDVRDYSDSDTGSDDQSNVGWTYYNKVMTHVNGMLQDSDMPSSASALYRNTRQHCLQMQIDKTNISVTKRVKFGDDPLGIHTPHIQPASTDTSVKMNQLAAKYLKTAPAPPPQPAPQGSAPFDMSFATRNYMERHKLIQSVPGFRKDPTATEIPRFLDITALKQQPKLL